MKRATILQINALADAAGATWRLLRANKHLRIAFTRAGRTVVLSIANSPSDQRALANVAADLRRAFRRWLAGCENSTCNFSRQDVVLLSQGDATFSMR